MSKSQPLKIAIIGGGLAGAVLANALQKHKHISIDIFESAPEFSERGAAVGIATNGQIALAEIGGAVADVIERAGGVTMTSTRLVLASGPNAMETLFDLAGEQRGKVVHRAALLAELLAPIDSKVKHTNKKVTEIEDAPNGQVIIHFSDASAHTADAVIGADGVRGFVRGHVLGANHPAVPAKPAGLWDCRALLPMARAKEILGEEYFQEDRQYGFVGDGGFFMHDVLDNGETVQCVFSIPTDESWGENEWTRNVSREDLEKAVQNWTDTPLKKGIVEAMLQNPDLKAFVQNHHALDAPTYTNGRACIMGDAAHCATPWQGSGAGMAIEDAMVLEALLGAVNNPAQLANAFQAYSDARIERTQRVVHSSIGTAQILVGRGEGIGLDVERIREMLPPRWGFIYGLDLGEHKKEAVERFIGM